MLTASEFQENEQFKNQKYFAYLKKRDNQLHKNFSEKSKVESKVELKVKNMTQKEREQRASVRNKSK